MLCAFWQSSTKLLHCSKNIWKKKISKKTFFPKVFFQKIKFFKTEFFVKGSTKTILWISDYTYRKHNHLLITASHENTSCPAFDSLFCSARRRYESRNFVVMKFIEESKPFIHFFLQAFCLIISIKQ